MEKIVEVLVTWQFALVCVVTSGLIATIGRIGSKRSPDPLVKARIGGLKDAVWFQRINPLLPYVVAVGLVCIPGIPLPETMPAGWGAKILFGLAAAAFSGEVYTAVKKLIKGHK